MATGRRAGVSTAKADILEAARELFAEAGFDRVTIRAIATRAGVDVALVSYYFGNKKGLFRAVMSMPVDPEQAVISALSGPRDGIGNRLVTSSLAVWEAQESGPGFRAVLRAAVDSDDKAASPLGEFIASVMVPALTTHAGVRVQTGRVVASTMFGLAFMRYLIRSPAFTEVSKDELIATYGPAIQRIIDADGA